MEYGACGGDRAGKEILDKKENTKHKSVAGMKYFAYQRQGITSESRMRSVLVAL